METFEGAAQNARTISQLKSRARYIKGYRVKLETIAKILEIARRIMEKIES